ncbi:centromere protein T isoform X1 [Python bivittatus]|uniref:Centromere protein T n=1 Tax=Python bivittatus TaxID=176946 RepID=A0A9F5ISW9_PYTBI|nr:centromere protein T isoform X1 [Python bivittatus]
MASRRSLRKQQPQEEPQGRRRSLRLHGKKAVPFSYQRSLAYQRPTTSAFMDFATPRTVFKKVLQTQPIVSPLVSEKNDSSKSIDTVFYFPVKASPSTNLEVSLPDSTQRDKPRIALHPARSKKVRLSAFERDLKKQLHSSAAQGLLDSTSLTKSLQISLSTPAPLNSAGKKGLIRRPKNYQGVNVKDFEGGLEQDLLQIKDSAQNYLEDLQAATLLSNDTEVHSAETEPFLQPHPSEENDTEPSNVPPEPVLARQSLASRSMPPFSQTSSARQDEMSDMEVERVAESSQKEVLAPGSESTIETETAPKEEADHYKEGCQESLQDDAKGLLHSLAKEKLSPGTEDASSVKSISQKNIATPQRQRQKHCHGNSPVEEFSSPKEPLNTGMGAVRSSTPTDAELPVTPQGHLSTWLSQKSVRRSMNEMVTHIIRELDDIVPAVAGQDVAKVGLEQGFSLGESAIDISQRPRVRTPNRYACGMTPKQLKRTPFREMRDGTIPQMDDGSRTKEMLNVETEQVLGFEAESNPEVEMSESENIEPTGNTPAFVHAKAFHCTPLLSSPCVLKEVASRSPVKQSLVQPVPKPAKRVRREKREPSLPSNLVKKMFIHYVKMPVAKDALEAVERCVNLYFKHLSNDLEAYVNHARRKTAELADLELLMRRQGLITDKMPLNVLVERHLPMEYRKLLIPVARSGNKVIPQKPR